MPRGSHRQVKWLVVAAVLAAAGISHAGWRYRHLPCPTALGHSPPASSQPRSYGCRCYIFPVYNLGDGWWLYHTEVHVQCDHADDCNSPSIEYYAALNPIWPQDCTEGACGQRKAETRDTTIPRLDRVKPSRYAGEDIAADLNPRPLTSRYIRFRSPRGEIHARVFLMEVAIGENHRARTLGFGCEVRPDDEIDYITIGQPVPHIEQPYMFECVLDDVRYVVLTRN